MNHTFHKYIPDSPYSSLKGGEEESVRLLPSPANTSEGGMVSSRGENKGDVQWHAGPGEGGALVCLTEAHTTQGHGAEGCRGCLRTCQVSDTEALISCFKEIFVVWQLF